MAVSAGLAAVKFVAAMATGSLGLLSEAFHSLTDVGATVITLVAVSFSDRPADAEHHFGHAKIESLAALLEIILLCGVVAYFTYESLSRLSSGTHGVDVTWWAIAILVASIALDYNRSKALSRVAEETSSGALAADAIHFKSDMLGSAAVLVGLGLVWLGVPWGDSAATLVVAGSIAVLTWRLARQTIATLLDAAPEGVSQTIRTMLENRPEVLSVRQLRVKPAGPVHFISVIVEVPRTLRLDEIAKLQQSLEEEVHDLFPASDVMMSAIPVALDTETVFDKVHLLASQSGHMIHHLTVQDVDGKTAVSFDIEFDGAKTLLQAHAEATDLETAIRQSLGGDVEVESHIEPLPSRALAGHAANPSDYTRISAAINQSARDETTMSDIHNVRVRFTDGGYFVHYHCRFADDTPVEQAHNAIDRVEQRLVTKLPAIKRVVAHAEPLGAKPHPL